MYINLNNNTFQKIAIHFYFFLKDLNINYNYSRLYAFDVGIKWDLRT